MFYVPSEVPILAVAPLADFSVVHIAERIITHYVG